MTESVAPAGYTISLFVSRTPSYYAKEGYDTVEFPGETVELGRVELRGSDLGVLLGKTKDHIDLIEES